MRSEAMKMEAKCERCGGRMTFEWFAGKAGLIGCWRYRGWRCICCGEVIDSLILINRIRGGRPKKHETRFLAKTYLLA